MGILCLLQLVLFLRSKSSWLGNYPGGCVDFVSFSRHGRALSIWWMVFGSRGPQFRTSARAASGGMGRHGPLGAAVIFRQSHQQYFFGSTYDRSRGWILDVRGGELLGRLY